MPERGEYLHVALHVYYMHILCWRTCSVELIVRIYNSQLYNATIPHVHTGPPLGSPPHSLSPPPPLWCVEWWVGSKVKPSPSAQSRQESVAATASKLQNTQCTRG